MEELIGTAEGIRTDGKGARHNRAQGYSTTYSMGRVCGCLIEIKLNVGARDVKIIAKYTDWVGDDEIYTLLAGTFKMIRKPPPASGVPSMEDRGEEIK